MRTRVVLLAISLLTASVVAASAWAAHHEGTGKGKRFEKRDTDGDGTVSKAEWMEFSEIRFTETDTDSDGSIRKSEWDAKKKAMREQRKQGKAAGRGY